MFGRLFFVGWNKEIYTSNAMPEKNIKEKQSLEKVE